MAHGYTLTQVNGMAVFAARQCNWVNGMALTYRAEVAWSAIAEHLHTAYQPPAPGDLIASGWAAMKAQHYQDLQTYGHGGKDASQLSRAYCRYWNFVAAPTTAHEDRIVDRLAFWQIWAVLTPAHREILRAVAEHETHAAARGSLGLSVTTYNSRLTRARRAFWVLWHQGEAPPRTMWGADRPGARHQNPMYLLRQRKRKSQQRADQDDRPTRRIGRPPRDIGVSNADLLARHEAGQSQTSLATAFGIGRDAIRTRIDNARAGREDAGAAVVG